LLSNNRFSSLAGEYIRPKNSGFNGPCPSSGVAVQGSWGKKLIISNNDRVNHTPSHPIKLRKPVSKVEIKLTRPCAYCRDEEHLHHIRDCPVLTDKNRRKADASHKAKEQAKKQKWLAAEARIAEQVRRAQQQKEVVEVVEESSDSETDEYPALTTAIASGKVTTRRGPRKFSSWNTNYEASHRVSFKDDSENLMKPACETKVFYKDDPPSAISDEEEEEILLKPSAKAWKSRRQSSGMTSHERQVIIDEITEKEVELKSYGKDSWADAAEIEDIEKEILALRKKLD